MKDVLSIAGFTLIGLATAANISLLWDGNGIGIWISGLFSTLAISLPLLLFFIIGRSYWEAITKITSMIAFSLPVISEVSWGSVGSSEIYLLLLNGISLILCCISVTWIIMRLVKENKIEKHLMQD